MRSPIEALEEWLFKIKRANIFQVFHDEVDEAKRFKTAVESTSCPACDKPLKLRKFERGPKGWECEVICEGCNFTGLVSSAWTLLSNIDSIGRAREK